MKVQIKISGQISGNFKLLSAIGHGEGMKETMFNGFAISFNTKKDAIKAIREAYNYLCMGEPDRKGNLGGIRADRDRTVLYYDASKAEIL